MDGTLFHAALDDVAEEILKRAALLYPPDSVALDAYCKGALAAIAAMRNHAPPSRAG